MDLPDLDARIEACRKVRRFDEAFEAHECPNPGDKALWLYFTYRKQRDENQAILHDRFGYRFESGGIQTPVLPIASVIQTQEQADAFNLAWRSYCVGRVGCRLMEHWTELFYPVAEKSVQDPWSAFDEYAVYLNCEVEPYVWHVAAYPEILEGSIDSLVAFAVSRISLHVAKRLKWNLEREYDGNACAGLLQELPAAIVLFNPSQLSLEQFNRLPQEAANSVSRGLYRRKLEVTQPDLSEQPAPEPETDLTDSCQWELLEGVLNRVKLSKQERKVYELLMERDAERWRYRGGVQIAEILSLKPNHVRQVKKRILGKFKKALKFP